nr:hypothetical protein [uncultured Rhodopila sp.]
MSVWDEAVGSTAAPDVWTQAAGDVTTAGDRASLPLTLATPRPPTHIADTTGGGPPVSAGEGDVWAPVWEGLEEFHQAKDQPLMHVVPELTPEEMDTLRKGASPDEQREAGIAQGVAQNINGLTTPQNVSLLVGTMGLTGLPRVARAVALTFAAMMGKHSWDVANQLGEELGKSPADQDSVKIGELIGDGLVSTGMAGLTGFAGARPSPQPGRLMAGAIDSEPGSFSNVEGEALAGVDAQQIRMPTIEMPGGPEILTAQDFLNHAPKPPILPKPPLARAAGSNFRPEVPETPAENYETGVQEIRRLGARTIGDIQRLWPNAELNREQARAWRDAAWGKQEGPVSASLASVENAPVTKPEALEPEKTTPTTAGAAATRTTSEAAGTAFTASTPAEGVKVKGNYDLVEANDLVTSFDPEYEQALQPRDRARMASQNQLADIVQRFEPQRLGESVTTDLGAPMVDEKGQVLSGNGRTTAIRTMYGTDKAGPYRDWLAQNAEDFGLTPEDVQAMTQPVLVRRVTDYGGLEKAEFARQSNMQQVMGMGEAEKAAADAKMLGANPKLMDAFRPGEDGNVLATANREFLNAFIQGTGDKADLLTKDGYNGPALTKRVKNAVLGAFIGPENQALLGRIIEGADDLNIKNAVNGTMASAPSLVRFKGTPWDVSTAMHQAFKDLVSLRTSGEKLHDFLTSRPLFGDAGRTAESDLILKHLAEAKSQKAVVDGLARYARAANEALTDSQAGGMFGDTPATREQLLGRVYGQNDINQAAGRGAQADLTLGKSPTGDSAGRAAPQPEGAAAGAGAGAASEGAGSAGGDAGPVTHSMAAGGAPAAHTTAPRQAPTRVIPPAGSVPPRAPATGLLSHFTRFRQSFQSFFSPQNIDPTAKRFSYILRENNAQAALDVARADKHLDGWRGFFDRTPVPKDWAYDPTKPLPFNYEVMDALERNRGALPPAMQDFARAFDQEFAWRIDQVRQLSPSAMQRLITDYFPHLWERPDAGAVRSLMSDVAARSPLYGNKAFLKQRTVPFIMDGLERGLRPMSDNPVDLLLAKMHQMDKFIAAAKIMQEAKAGGMLKYYPLGRRIPAGLSVVDDPAMTVYAPPVLEVPEAYDAGVRRGLMDFIDKMGWTHERVARLGVNEWGQYTQGGEIKSKFGAPDFVIEHEIGHGLEERYGLSRDLLANSTLQGEMKALADLRTVGVGGSKKFRKYIQTPDEQVANAVHAYIHAPEAMARVAPNVQTVLANVIRAHPELEDLNDIKPGLAVGTSKTALPLAGPVLAGHWTLPDGAAQVLTNYLSPGLQRFAPFRTLRAASNILNGAQLGWSAFHVGFTSVDAAVSSVATALTYALRGGFTKAVKSAAFAPVSPVANYFLGKAVQMKMLDPLATRVPVLDFPRIGIKGFGYDLGPSVDAACKQVADLAVKGGLRADIDPFWKTTITRNLVRAVHEGGMANYAKAGMALPWALVEQSVRPIAEFLVPRQKLGVFAQLARQEMDRIGAGASTEDVRGAMARAADWTEDRMGQMTYDNLFYNRMAKDTSLLGFRAYGWQLGKYRHMFGAVSDTAAFLRDAGEKASAAVQGKPSSTPALQVTNRMLYPVALTMVAATVGAIANRVLSGQWPTSTMDAFFPRNGQTDRNGRPERLMLPMYLKDLASDWHDFPNLKKMGESFYHKLNPGIAAVVDMWRNQDYYGVNIRQPDDSPGQQAADLAKFAAKQFVPFSVSGAMKMRDEAAPASQMVLPFFGIVPAKRSLTMTPAQTLAGEIAQAGMPVGGRTRAGFDHSVLLRTIVQDLRQNGQGGAKLPAALADGQVKPSDVSTITSMLNVTPFQYQVGRMPVADAMRVWRVANPDERAELRGTIQLKVARAKTLEPGKAGAYLQELAK